MTPKFHALTVADVRRETEDTVSVAFTIPEELKSDYAYKAGQYLTLRSEINGEDLRRSYSICTAPHENEWRVAIKQVENGQFSTWANTVLQNGDELQVMTPAGHFAFTPDATRKANYVLFAAGSGITPVLAMIKTILLEEPKSSVTLIFGNRGFYNIIFRETLEALKNAHMERFRIVHVLSRESLGNPLQKGRIDEDKVNRLYTAFFRNETIDGVFICGPEEMIHAVKNSMMANGVEEKNIHFELFGTSVPKAPVIKKEPDVNAVDSLVTVILDGDQIELALNSDDVSILDAAQRAGADLPFACKGGVCCTCKARILEGSARMDVNYALEKDEVEAGYILTCQSHPTSETLIVSFDE